MKYELKQVGTDRVVYTADIDCDENLPDGRKKGLAILHACENGVEIQCADLSGAIIHNFYFGDECSLIDCDIKKSIWVNCSFNKLRLTGSELCGSEMVGLRIQSGDFKGVYFNGSIIHGCEMGYSSFEGASFYDSRIRYVNFSGCELHGSIHVVEGKDDSDYFIGKYGL